MSRSTQNIKQRKLNNKSDRLIQTALPQTWINKNKNSSSPINVILRENKDKKLEDKRIDDVDGKLVDSDDEFKDEDFRTTINQPTDSLSSGNKKYIQTTVRHEEHLNLPFGDHILDEKQGCIILFHNINGMKDNKNWYQILSTMKDMNVDIFGFTEVNRSLTRGYSSEWINMVKKVFYYSRTTNSESCIQLESSYKPGGTLSTITGKWQSRVTEMGQDKELGRWSYIQITSRKTSLVIMTAY
jgi:hypothetical protein